jgi:hypothetical protein
VVDLGKGGLRVAMGLILAPAPFCLFYSALYFSHMTVLHPKGGGQSFLRNFSTCLPNYHIREDHNVNNHCSTNFKSHIFLNKSVKKCH